MRKQHPLFFLTTELSKRRHAPSLRRALRFHFPLFTPKQPSYTKLVYLRSRFSLRWPPRLLDALPPEAFAVRATPQRRLSLGLQDNSLQSPVPVAFVPLISTHYLLAPPVPQYPPLPTIILLSRLLHRPRQTCHVTYPHFTLSLVHSK